MLVFSGLGFAPRQGSVSSRCAMYDQNGVCIQGTQGTNYGGWGGMAPRVMGTYAASPSATWQSGPSVIYPTTPTSTPPVVQPGFPSNALPLPPQVAVSPISPAPSQQPPPMGLPEQPALQPGVQVSNQDQDAVITMTPVPLGKFALWALGAAIAGAGVGVLIHRRRARMT